MNKKVKVNIWGSRGSCTQTDSSKKIYGLETSCITLEMENKIIVIDTGSGIINFDKYLYNNNLQHKKIEIFFTHYHYDHISGLPFTRFIYDKNVKADVYGKGLKDKNFGEVLNHYFGPPYFPVKIFNTGNININEIYIGDEIDLGDVIIKTTLLKHTDECVGYKLKCSNKNICIIFDYEYMLDTNKSEVIKFIKDSDILIIDSHYTNVDYKENWGHSTIEDNIMLITQNNIKQGLLTHHNPNYTDEYMANIENNLLKEHKNISFARDYMEIQL